MKPYERLRAWVLAHELVLHTYSRTASFPPHERFGLTMQARRAAFSVAANIAEGSAKRGHKEFRRYLDIANGSIAELGYCFRLARDLGNLTSEDYAESEALRDEAARTVYALYRSLDRPSDRPTVRPSDRPTVRPSDRPTA